MLTARVTAVVRQVRADHHEAGSGDLHESTNDGHHGISASVHITTQAIKGTMGEQGAAAAGWGAAHEA